MDLLNKFENMISFKSLRKSVLILWVFLLAGGIILGLFILLAMLAGKDSFWGSLLQNIGYLIMLIAVLMAYAGVYKTSGGESEFKVRSIIFDTVKKAHFIAAIAAGIMVAFLVIVLAEAAVSMLGFIPYAGPFILTLLTIPYFLINFICTVVMVCVFFMAPPMVIEGKSLRDIAGETAAVIKDKWAQLLLFVMVSGFLLFLFVFIVFIISRYAGGITKAVQWNLDPLYTKTLKAAVSNSSIADLVGKIVPAGPKTLPALEVLKGMMGVFYGIIYSCIFSLLLAVYFHAASLFYKYITKKQQ